MACAYPVFLRVWEGFAFAAWVFKELAAGKRPVGGEALGVAYRNACILTDRAHKKQVYREKISRKFSDEGTESKAADCADVADEKRLEDEFRREIRLRMRRGYLQSHWGRPIRMGGARIYDAEDARVDSASA